MHTAVGYPVLIRGFRLALTVEGLRPHIINNFVRDVERLASHYDGRDPHSITPTDIRAHILMLHERCAAKTVYEAQLALRRFFRFLVREGEIQADPTRDVKLRSSVSLWFALLVSVRAYVTLLSSWCCMTRGSGKARQCP